MLTDKPEEDADHIPVALGNPAADSEALFANAVVKATAEARCLCRHLSQGMARCKWKERSLARNTWVWPLVTVVVISNDGNGSELFGALAMHQMLCLVQFLTLSIVFISAWE